MAARIEHSVRREYHIAVMAAEDWNALSAARLDTFDVDVADANAGFGSRCAV